MIRISEFGFNQGGGVLNDTDTNQKYIKKGRKLSYNGISNILNEVGNIKKYY